MYRGIEGCRVKSLGVRNGLMRLSRVYCVVARGAVMSTNVPAGRVAGGVYTMKGIAPELR